MRVLRPILAAGILALLASPAFAQDRFATVDVRAGYTFGSGVAKDSLKGQSSFGAGAWIALGNRLHVGVTGDWAHHSQYVVLQLGTPPVPTKTVIGGVDDLQWSVLHAFLKASFDLVQSKKVTFALNAGPGLMIFSPNQKLKDQRGVSSNAHAAVNVGTTLTYWFSDRIGILGSGQADIALKKSSGSLFQTKSAMLFPITGGFAFKI
jgi:hypothetical protein